MWQRIQTVFLALVITSLIVSVFFPIWSYSDPLGQSHALYPLEYRTVQNAEKNSTYMPYAITAILTFAAVTIAFIEIRKYRDRVLQMKLGALNSLFMVGTIGSAYYFSNQLLKTFQGGGYGLGFFLPAAAVLCNLLANTFIRRDERIVRESDRLR
ncbi:MAG TPA: DUF4293 domain-containing protein [Chryseosolibacter sp.]|nr:DUF4293 domain-containing protein [Chryseosolibacter sp.]